ncbi:hypothetical protein SBY92_004953 [Candida maltosa Xu316]
MNQSISNFLTKSNKHVVNKLKCSPTTLSSIKYDNIPLPESEFKSMKPKYQSAADFYENQPPIPYQCRGSIPTDKSDIRGTDGTVHKYIFQKFRGSKYPPIERNEFMSIQFFPENHILSNFRKSNISMIISMFGIPPFNNQGLAKALSQYKGEFSNSQFFSAKVSPVYSAFGRNMLRKIFRQLYVDAVKDIKGDTTKLAGIYCCVINKVPITQDHRKKVIEGYQRAMKKIMNDKKTQNQLNDLALASSLINVRTSLYGIRYNWDVGEYKSHKVRFPFLNMNEIRQANKSKVNTSDKMNHNNKKKRPKGKPVKRGV